MGVPRTISSLLRSTMSQKVAYVKLALLLMIDLVQENACRCPAAPGVPVK